MQHQYWITKQTLSRKLGRKEDECIVSSDAQLDAKLELFRNIQMSCTLIQRIIDKYQESICYLSQEINSMGRFLKESTNEEKTRAGDVMLTIGKSLIYCAQQQLVLHEPLIRFYQELETFRQRAVADTLQNVLAMEKARTEYRAALSWMKNVSQQLDPDTTKQLEKFKKVQHEVRRGKTNFDKQSLDCLQKIDLLAAARCNMFNYTLSFYQNKLINYIEKSARTYVTISEGFDRKKETPEEISIRRLSKDENNSKSEDKKITNDNSDFLGKVLLSVNKNTNDSTIIEKLISVDLNTSEVKNQNEMENSLFQFCDWSLPTDSPKSHSDAVKENLNKTSVSTYQNLFEDENSFLPSALLKQSLETALIMSKSQKNYVLKDNINMDSPTKSDSNKSWMNLFKELDPLSNNLNEKFPNNKGSLV